MSVFSYERASMNIHTKAASWGGGQASWVSKNKDFLPPVACIPGQKSPIRGLYPTQPIFYTMNISCSPECLPPIQKKKIKEKIVYIFFCLSYSQPGWSTVCSSKSIFVNNCQVFILVQVTRGRENTLGEVKQINRNTKINCERSPL